VLCAGLVEATALAAQLGPEAMHHLMQACLATAQQVMLHYGGTLTHITGEGFVALFGAPRAHEDHVRGAVLAAVALQQDLQSGKEGVRPRVPLGIGVHTGPVVVGALGADQQQPSSKLPLRWWRINSTLLSRDELGEPPWLPIGRMRLPL
jgi:adenylate cyclase